MRMIADGMLGYASDCTEILIIDKTSGRLIQVVYVEYGLGLTPLRLIEPLPTPQSRLWSMARRLNMVHKYALLRRRSKINGPSIL
jgi:hypothetical protein